MHELAHLGIQVKDLAASERFYTSVLGCRKSGSIDEEDVRISFLEFANGTIELVQLSAKGNRVSHSPSVHLAFEVSDVDQEYARIKGLGAPMVDEAPRYFSGGRLFFFTGPDGESIEFCSGIRVNPP